jgi:hypothetical protein
MSSQYNAEVDHNEASLQVIAGLVIQFSEIDRPRRTSAYDRNNRLAPNTPVPTADMGITTIESGVNLRLRAQPRNPYAFADELRANPEIFGYPPSDGTATSVNDNGDSILPCQTAIIPVPGAHITDVTTTGTTEENYWPNIAHWISTGEGPKPLVTCNICYVTKLTIPGLQEESITNNANSNDGEYENYHVLHCGHVLGATCLEHWLRECLQTVDDEHVELGPRCPICRQAVYRNQAELQRAEQALFREAIEEDIAMMGGDEWDD